MLAGLGPGSRVAGYLLLEQVGAGGMAVVFRARDQRLRRQVALKILAPALAADQAFRQRFIRESQGAAAVDDPHIIPVYEAGEADGVLFIAMRYVPGGDVGTLLRQQGRLSPARAAAIISPVAAALDAAHAAGLVHRDVKPTNMLVDARPNRPDHVYLSDFGLSKGELASVGLTGSGQFLGTPNYMAPEQIEGQPVDGRTDEYALACAAFELFTGAAPFQRDQAMAVIWAHVSRPAPLLSSRRPGLPAAADQVFVRALAKRPGDRYASCEAFADALREALGLPAYYSTEPGDAPPAPAVAVGVEPALAPAVGTEPVSGSVTAVPTAAAAPAEATIGPTEPTSVPAPVTVTSDPGRSVPAPSPHSDQTPAIPADASTVVSGLGGLRHRRFVQVTAVLCLVAAATVVALVLSSPPGTAALPGSSSARSLAGTFADSGGAAVNAVAFSPHGGTLAVGDGSGATYLWSTVSGQILRTLTDPSGSQGIALVDAVAFSPDGAILATGDHNGATYLWSVSTGHLIRSLIDSGAPESEAQPGVTGVAFSPDGNVLATADQDGITYLWNVATGQLIAELRGTQSDSSVAFSPDGRTLAVGAGDSVSLWDVATKQNVATLDAPTNGAVNAVAFSPNGRLLAAGSLDDDTYLWNVTTRRIAATLRDPSGAWVNAVAFNRVGGMLAVGDNDDRTYVWNVATDQLILTFLDTTNNTINSLGGEPSVNAVAFSPDGQTLATGDADDTTYLWHIG